MRISDWSSDVCSSDLGRWLQIAAYTDPINALAMRDELIRHGLAGVVVSQSGGGNLHRVMVGPFDNDKDAQSARQWLHDAGYEIGRAHVEPPVTNAHLVCRLLLEKKKQDANHIRCSALHLHHHICDSY